MKYTLLDVTQAVLSSMDSDQVTSINDTTESQQVVLLIRNVYLDIVDRADLPEDFTLFRLTETSASTPTVMTTPTDVSRILWVKYNRETTTDTDQAYTDMIYQPKYEFLSSMYLLKESDTTTGSFTKTIDSDTINFMYRKDISPTCYTSYDDNTIVFDSVDTTVDTFLRASKTVGYGKKVVTFTSSDSFAFSKLDEPQHQLLLNECKALAWAELRQTQHAKAERQANRGWFKLQTSKHLLKPKYFDELPNYGRGRR